MPNTSAVSRDYNTYKLHIISIRMNSVTASSIRLFLEMALDIKEIQWRIVSSLRNSVMALVHNVHVYFRYIKYGISHSTRSDA